MRGKEIDSKGVADIKRMKLLRRIVVGGVAFW
jgi:hypothetical protein